ncbi:T4 RnlA family RNA ligase [Kordia sp.]|uniref:T4 RnlA family RNA ligase n=1 Tax=Kordia sp. TaxID=1965332 RepID=UPI0025B837E7|nr:T4 RnlA family RNA ligase [Kordia sp.]MCH2195341.1 T4 RnlA family RNA ligase [Kordia sp.]
MNTSVVHIEKLKQAMTDGYIHNCKHPNANLWIYNYTQAAQYDQYWTKETLQCRGLILDEDYNIVANPIQKFFNVEEIGYDKLPNVPFNVFEKMDGSLGILYWLKNTPYIATRGSFTSKQALKATKLLHEIYANTFEKLDRSKTYVFEIIYPENRIIVDYGTEEKLVLLAIVDTATGKNEALQDIGFPLPTRYNFSSLLELKALNWKNQEGFVIQFENGFRVKIKFEDYIELHKIVTQVSSLTIWETLKTKGTLTQWIENVPDEFYTWVRKVEAELRANFTNIENIAKAAYKELATDRETAAYFKTFQYPAILFAMKNNKKYDQIIWRYIRPTFEKAYSNEFN